MGVSRYLSTPALQTFQAARGCLQGGGGQGAGGEEGGEDREHVLNCVCQTTSRKRHLTSGSLVYLCHM